MNEHCSLWSARTEMPRFPRLQEDISTDTLIIGGGMAGLLCAHMLTRSGADCVLAEAGRICGGVTKNTTAKISSQHGLIYSRLRRERGPEAARLYLEANEAALDAYRVICQGIDCGFESADSYVYSTGDTKALELECEAAREAGFEAELTQPPSLPFPVSGAVKFARQAQFDALSFAAGIARGLRIYENTAVRELKGFTAVTDGGRISAKRIVVATHFPFINKHGSYFLKLYQQRSYVIALKNAGGVDGMYVDASDGGLSFRSFEDYLLLGGGSRRTGKPCGGWRELEELAAKYYPRASIEYRWATQDCVSLDAVPYIGQYSRLTPGLYVATGFNKWGMSSSMAAAMLLNELLAGRESPYAELFSPSRSILRPQLALNAAEAVASLLTLRARRCPHMGCALKWNERERSWDCPCHGSRFYGDGGLIERPSTGDLK